MRRRRQASDEEDFSEEDNVDLHFRADRTVGESSDGDFCTAEESEVEKSEDGITTVPVKLIVGIDGAMAEMDGESATEGVTTVPVMLNVGIGAVTAEIDVELVNEGVVTKSVKQVFDKKKKTLEEPYVIPVSGAYYMHDDRLRKNGGHRRFSQKYDERNLWKFEDKHKWEHDKFEELPLQETHSKHTALIEVGKTTKSFNQAHSNNQGRDKYLKDETGRTVKGRGPVMYKPIERNNRPNLQARDNQDGRFLEKNSSTSSARVPTSDPTITHPQSSVQNGLPLSSYQPTPNSDVFDRFYSSSRNRYIKQSESGSPLGLQRNKFQVARTENRGGIAQGGGRSANLARNYHDKMFPNAHFRGQDQSDPDMTCPANEFTRGIEISFKPELLSEENDQRRMKPQRYSTMNFNK